VLDYLVLPPVSGWRRRWNRRWGKCSA